MGTINYKTSDYITLAIRPYDFEDMKAAMIAYLEQMRGNFNTWTYPKDLEGIYKSQAVQDRILYDLTDDITVYAQRA